MQTRYDYLLHATVPTSENWGIKELPAWSGPTEIDALHGLLRASFQNAKDSPETLKNLKRLNRALAEAEWTARSTYCHSRPSVIQLSQTEVCNLLCTYCRPTVPQNLKTMAGDRCLQALRLLLPTALEFIPYCWGEPLLSPEFVEMCELASSWDTAVSFVTNLHSLSDRVAEVFARCVTRAQISIDTCDPEKFRQIRRGGDLSKIEANIAKIRRLADSRHVPWLGISVVLTRSNMDGVLDLVDWAADQGLQGVCVRRVVVRERLPHFQQTEEIDLLSHEYLTLLENCKTVSATHHMALNMPDPVRGQRATPPCRCLWDHVYVSASGELNMCVFSHRKPWGSLPIIDDYWNAGEILARRQSWNDETRCEECSSLDFLERPDVSQVRGY